VPKLLLKFHAAVIKEIPIEKTPVTIGRKPDNDIVIDNMAVSSHHARIVMQGDTYMVEDLQSTNGTFLNEKRILSSALQNNDTILLGQHSLQFVNPQPVKPPEPPAEPKTEEAKLDTEATVLISPVRQQQILKEEAEPSGPVGAPKSSLTGLLKVIEGKSENNEYPLTSLLTYIGKSETAAIKIKGFFAPDIAVLISKRPAAYLLTAVKDGYPKVNNVSVSGQLELKDNDILEVGGIKFLFQLKPS